MAGDRDEPISSEEMIRRAREAQATGSTSPPTGDAAAGSMERVESPQPPAEADAETDEPEPIATASDSGSTLAADEPASAAVRATPTNGQGPALPGMVSTAPPSSLWRRVWRWGRWVILGVVVLNVIGALLNQSESVNSLEVGDCFMDPGIELITEVETIECSESHDLELYARVDITGFGGAYPGAEPLAQWLGDQCVSRFEAYVGSDFATSAYWVFTITPNGESWESGDHLGLCTVYVGDAQGNITSSTGSVRNSGR